MLKLYLYVTAAASAVTFFLFGADKLLSRRGGDFRLPEKLLLFFTSFGGGAGALLGRGIFRHKTNFKTKFHFAVGTWTAFILQAGIGIYIYLLSEGVL